MFFKEMTDSKAKRPSMLATVASFIPYIVAINTFVKLKGINYKIKTM